jgi:lipopolysaccharide transport system ATP-binding protein
MDDIVVNIQHATVRYNLAIKKQMGLKEYMHALLQHKLFYQEFLAIQDINLRIMRGESWGFVGKNGSGKSTLLKLVTGILRPYKGTVTVSGSVAPLLELGAGFDMELTGKENIYLNGLILGMPKAEIDARFDEIVDFAELEKFLDVPVKNYSSGMKSRLSFSIATCARADILIADEVLATGDKQFQIKCEQRMQKMLEGGTTLLYVSHSPGAITRLCQKAMWLDHGCCMMQGEANDVVEAYEKAK